MPRLLSTLLVLGLLGGTAAAFAVTERLKLVPSPIVAPRVTKAFSPVCRCPTATATIQFRLRDADRLTVSIVDGEGDRVAELADDEPHDTGQAVFTWTGDGAPEGTYRARVHLADARRTIVIPNRIRLDTTAPRLIVESVAPAAFSPDGDGRADKVRVTYSVSEPSSILLQADGRRAVETPPRRAGKIDWYGRRLRPRVYDVTLVATDVAGNRSDSSAPIRVRLRFIALTPRRLVVPADVRFGVRVATDARRYRWRLGARRGSSGTELLVLRAPQRPGRYTLVVAYGRYRDAVPVFVRPRP